MISWPLWRAALQHQLLLTFRDRRTLLMVVALSLLFGLVSANTFAQQGAGGAATIGADAVAVSLDHLPAEAEQVFRQVGLTLVDTADPEGAVARGEAEVALVLEPGARGRFVARPGAGAAPPGRHQPGGDEILGVLLTLLVTVPAIGATGAAAELGAGERERKTLEPLLMTPLPPFVLAGAKLAAVLAASLLSAGLAVAVQLLLLLWLGWSQVLPPFGEPLATLAPILLLCVTVAVLVSGPALIISLVARSMREATLAMIPLNLVAIGLAYLSVRLPLQGLSDSIWYAPGLNALLLVRQAVAGVPVGVGQAAAVTLSTLLVAVGLTWLAARQLRREAVL